MRKYLLLLCFALSIGCRKTDPFLKKEKILSSSGKTFFVVNEYTPFEQGGFGVDFVQLLDSQGNVLLKNFDAPKGYDIAEIIKISKNQITLQCLKGRKRENGIIYDPVQLIYDIKAKKFNLE